MAKDLDSMVEDFRHRPLDGAGRTCTCPATL